MKKIVKITLLLVIGFSIKVAKAQKSYGNDPTLHMIIVADTDDESIGESCEVDFQNIKNLATDIRDNARMNLATYYYKESKFKKKEIERKLDNLVVKDNDAVFFYYTGHGYRARNATSPFPRLLVLESEEMSKENQGISVDDIRKKIKEKNPRLSVVMIDACNGTLPIDEPGGTSGYGRLNQQLRRLFVNSAGEVVFCGSKAGDGDMFSGEYTGLSWSSPVEGGFLTYSFNYCLEKALKSRHTIGWETLLSNTKKVTMEMSRVRLKNKGNGQNVQIPYYITNLTQN